MRAPCRRRLTGADARAARAAWEGCRTKADFLKATPLRTYLTNCIVMIMERDSKFSVMASRAILGIAFLALLIGALHDVWLGEYNLGGTPILRSEQPITFWLYVGFQGALSAFGLRVLFSSRPSKGQK